MFETVSIRMGLRCLLEWTPARQDSKLLLVLILPRHARAIQTPGRTLKQPASARPDTVSQTVFRSKHLGTCLTVAIKDHGIQKKTRGQ